jgi:hypothetical protein
VKVSEFLLRNKKFDDLKTIIVGSFPVVFGSYRMLKVYEQSINGDVIKCPRPMCPRKICLGCSVPWTMDNDTPPLDDSFLRLCVPWTMRSLDDASLG